MVAAQLIDDADGLEAVRAEWDALAVARGMPYMAPAWALAWWRRLRPERARLRAVAVRDGEALVGLAPLYVEPRGGLTRCHMMGAAVSLRVAPLAAPGRGWEVAAAVTEALAASRPRPEALELEAVALGSPWPALVRERWPGPVRPSLLTERVHGAPTLALRHDSYDAWLASRSANFRGQLRRLARRLEREGGAVRMATAATLRADLDAFLRLHAARWEGRGDSPLTRMGAPLVDMLEDAGGELLGSGRLRLWVVELGGEPVALQLFVAAGGEVAFFNGGWDERHAPLRPALLALAAAVEDAFGRGERRIDLGGGEQSYKLRFADGNDPVQWGRALLPGPRYPLTVARTAPRRVGLVVRGAVKRGLPEDAYERLRSARRRLG
jgi:CelD/BcsL family acetyltransferase involved in cellulose biosynthesis